MVVVKVKDKEFYLDGFLKEKLDNVKEIVHKRNFDCVFLIDGLERIGKSTLGITCGYYLSDGNFTAENVCVDSIDAVKKIESLPDKSVLLLDEGSLIFSSRDSMAKEQRKLMKIMNVVGQKNMIFIVVLPSFFDLNKQIAVRRSRFLIHCYSDEKLNRGRFAYYGEDKKKLLFSLGKKNFDSYAKPKSNFFGRFTDFNPLGEEYLESKKKSLFSALHQEIKRDVRVIKAERLREVIYHLEQYKFPVKITQKEKAKMLGIAYKTYKYHITLLHKEGTLAKG